MNSILRRFGKGTTEQFQRTPSPWDMAEKAYNDISTPKISLRALKAASLLEPLTCTSCNEKGYALLRYADYLGVAARFGLSDGLTESKVLELQKREMQACEEASSHSDASIRQSALYHLCIAAGTYGDRERAERAYHEAIQAPYLHLSEGDLARMRRSASLKGNGAMSPEMQAEL